jgi:hypothetical protein
MDLNGDGATYGVETFLVNLVALSLVVGAVGVIWSKVVKPMFKNTRTLIKRTNTFFDDWYGDENTPGVVSRITSLEVEVEKVRLQVVQELNRNGGSSTKDAAFEALRIVQDVQVQQEQEVQDRKYLTAQLERILGVNIDQEAPPAP